MRVEGTSSALGNEVTQFSGVRLKKTEMEKKKNRFSQSFLLGKPLSRGLRFYVACTRMTDCRALCPSVKAVELSRVNPNRDLEGWCALAVISHTVERPFLLKN